MAGADPRHGISIVAVQRQDEADGGTPFRDVRRERKKWGFVASGDMSHKLTRDAPGGFHSRPMSLIPGSWMPCALAI